MDVMNMNRCVSCQRPFKDGYYRTESGKCYCYDCFIKNKEIISNLRNQNKDLRDRLFGLLQKEEDLKQKIKNAGYEYSSNNKREYFITGITNVPVHIQQMVDEITSIEKQRKQHSETMYNNIPRLTPDMSELEHASYCEI